ncbi:hypothetical protein DFH07DRAFT_721711, partial [Mycena maculata]
DLGFEGPDMEVKKRQEILQRSKVFTAADVAHVEDARYTIRSRSDPSKVYDVDIDAYTCTCRDYP